MESFASIIGLWPTAVALGADIDEKPGTVRRWAARNSIPADRWPSLIASAMRRGFGDKVTYETLARIAARRRSLPLSEAPAGGAGAAAE